MKDNVSFFLFFLRGNKYNTSENRFRQLKPMSRLIFTTMNRAGHKYAQSWRTAFLLGDLAEPEVCLAGRTSAECTM